MVTAVDELKEARKPRNPGTDLQPQLDDLNKRFEAYQKEINKRMSEPVVDPETGEVKPPPFNDGNISMLKNQIDLCV